MPKCLPDGVFLFLKYLVWHSIRANEFGAKSTSIAEQAHEADGAKPPFARSLRCARTRAKGFVMALARRKGHADSAPQLMCNVLFLRRVTAARSQNERRAARKEQQVEAGSWYRGVVRTETPMESRTVERSAGGVADLDVSKADGIAIGRGSC